MTIGEAGVSFYSAGGHSHDGENSTRIDSTKYSVWDWEWDIITDSTPSRLIRQITNYNSFQRSVVDVVTNIVLRPAGLELLPNTLHGTTIVSETISATQIAANTITADNIQSGTITGNLLNANIVLVNQVIASNNYVPGVSGWAIDGDGTAEFDAASIRGTITAGAVNIGADDFWNSDGSFKLGGNTGIYTSNGNIIIGSSVEIDGDVYVANVYIDQYNYWRPADFRTGDANNFLRYNGANVTVKGNIIALAGQIGDWTIDSGGELVGFNGDNATLILDPSGIGKIYTPASEGDPNWILITGGDVYGDDLTGRSRVRSGSTAGNASTEMQFPGVFYTHAAQGTFGTNNYGWAFTYDNDTGNVWAHMWDPAANGGQGAYTISKCLANCGSTTASTTLAPTTTTTTSGTTTPNPGTTTTTTTTTTTACGNYGCGFGFCDSCQGCVCNDGLCMCP